MPTSGKFTEKLSLKKKKNLKKEQGGLGKIDLKSPTSSGLMYSCTGVMVSRQKSRDLELGFHASLKNNFATEYE